MHSGNMLVFSICPDICEGVKQFVLSICQFVSLCLSVCVLQFVSPVKNF